jgi:tetratricopeptide (TPR) repeat protein
MLYAYEKLDLKRLRKTKIGSYRIEVSKLELGQPFINKGLLWIGLLIGSLVGLLGVGYYFFADTLSAIPNKSNREVTKVQLQNNHSNPNLLSTPETKTLSQPNPSLTKTIPAANLVNPVENQFRDPVHPSSQPLLKSIPIQPQESEQSKLTRLLQQCEKYLQANHLTTGKEGNAFDCYQQVLAQAPNQVEAKSGLQQIETRYQDWLRAALRQEQYTKVHRYWEKIQLVNPQSTMLTQIETDLQQKITRALSAKRVIQANHYLKNWAELNPNSLVLPTLKQDLVRVISTWVQQCDRHFQANRLTMGKSGNALECYQQVLTQDPNNSQAKVGLKNLEKRYQQLIEQALQQKKLANAGQYLMRLQLINPQAKKLSQLRQRLIKLEQQSISAKSAIIVSPSLPAKDPAKANQPVTHSLPRLSPPSPSKQCSDIFVQESLGVRPLTDEQKQFKLQYCNK